MRRALGWLGAALLAAALAAAAAFAWVAGTTTGARWALDRVLPPEVSVDEVEGRLLGPLRLHGVRYRPAGKGPAAEAEVVEVRWRPRRLLSGTLAVERLGADGVRVRLPAGGDAPAALPTAEEVLRGLGAAVSEEVGEPLPLRLEVARIAVDGLRVAGRDGGRPVVVDRLRARGEMADGAVRVPRLTVRGPGLRVRAAGRLDPSAEPRTEGRLELRWRTPGDLVVDGEGWIRGGPERVDLELVTRSPVVARLEGTAREPRRPGDWALELELEELDTLELAWLAPGLPPARIGLTLGLRGTAEGAAGELGATLEADPLGRLLVRADLALGADTLAVDALELRHPATGGRVTAAGAAWHGAAGPGLRLDGRWSDLRWPLRGRADVRSPGGTFRAAGRPDSLRLAARARVAQAPGAAGPWRVAVDGRRVGARVAGQVEARGPLAGLGDVALEAAASLEADSVHLRKLRAELLGGTVAGSGRWAPAGGDHAVSASLEARGLDPSHAWPGWAGALSFVLQGEARIGGGAGPRGSLRLADLSGTLRGREVAGEARLRGSSGAWRLDTLRLRSGEARLEAGGEVDGRWELGWALDSARLADAAPGLEGRLSASGRVDGPRSRPRVSATAEASSVAGWGVRAGALEASLAWTGGLDGEGRIEVEGRSVSAGGLAVDSLRLDAAGQEGRHRMHLQLADGATRLIAGAGGEMEGRAWSGALDSLVLRSPAVGAWGLVSPAPVALSADSARLGRLCWARAPSSVCLETGWSAQEGLWWTAGGEGLPLGFAGPWLPAGLEARGEFEVETEGRARPGEAVQGRLRLRARDGELRLAGGAGSRRLDSLLVRLDADAGGLRGQLLLAGEARDSLRLDAELGPPGAAGRPLAGRMAAGVSDRGLAGELVDPLASTEGRLQADLSLGGTADSPTLRGSVQLREGSADVIPAGLELRGAALRLSGDGTGDLAVTGGATSGAGAVTLEGTVTLPGLDPGGAEGGGPRVTRLDLRLRGKRFLAANTRAVRVVVSPDLRIEGGADGIAVGGELRVPEARVSPRRAQAAVPVSADVRVRGREAEAVERELEDLSARSTPVDVDVVVVLGDRVTVNGFGVRGRLTGKVAVSGRPGRPPTGRGLIELVEGQYTALRRALPLEHGRLVFTGSPLDDPGLDFRVVRRAGGVEVGLQIGGTARSPTISLFSTPPLSEADVLAYLFFGRPASAVDPSEGALLRGAARALGIVGGDVLVSRLGRVLPVDQVRLEGEQEGAAVVLGRRLSPRLDLGYAIGLFGVSNVLRLTYRLGRGWVVRAETGEQEGADLLYVIER